MPTYEYECERCGVFEVEQKISDPPLTTCPNGVTKSVKTPTDSGGFRVRSCGGNVKRLIPAATSFVLKGPGWFKDGY